MNREAVIWDGGVSCFDNKNNKGQETCKLK